jgi:riboflavin kinase/FMN adenylyltransferase
VPRGHLPLRGVFCVNVLRQNHKSAFGVANIGNRPTIDGHKNVLEVHLFDRDECLYGQMLTIVFLHKLRDEIKFSSVDDLVIQIHADVIAARTRLLTQSLNDLIE